MTELLGLRQGTPFAGSITRTLDGSALKGIKVMGKGLSGDVRDAASDVRFGLAYDQVTQMTLVVNDYDDLAIFRSGVFSPGATIQYGEWWMTVEDVDVRRGPGGPQLSITAPSRTVTRLREQTGAYSWGTRDVSAWAEGMIRNVGAMPVVQPGLGEKTIIREANEDGGIQPNSWDVLTQMARESGVWLFENGGYMIFARPSWLGLNDHRVRREIPLWWHDKNNYAVGMDGVPEYQHRPFADVKETMVVRLISGDADAAVPGDRVTMGGQVGPMAGIWIVTAVDYPFTVGAAVTVTCVRPVDPQIQPPAGVAAGSGGPGSGGYANGAIYSGGTSYAAGGRVSTVNLPTVAGRVAGRTVSFTDGSTANIGGGAPLAGSGSATDRWAASVNGRAIDLDGAFGAQCVDLTQHFNVNVVGGGRIPGNGRDWFANAPRANYMKYAVGGANGERASKGDIACWGPAMGGGYGHVAIVLEDRGNYLYCMSQNPGPSRPMLLSKSGLQGYLRPLRFR